MSICLCPGCSDAPDFLFSEDWRRATEAAHVCTMDKEHRREYYLGVRKKRGDPAMRQLMRDSMREWKETHRDAG